MYIIKLYCRILKTWESEILLPSCFLYNWCLQRTNDVLFMYIIRDIFLFNPNLSGFDVFTVYNRKPFLRISVYVLKYQ